MTDFNTHVAIAVKALRLVQDDFTSCDVWDALDEEIAQSAEESGPTVMGNAIKALRMAGIIVKKNVKGRACEGERGEKNHQRDQTVWEWVS